MIPTLPLQKGKGGRVGVMPHVIPSAYHVIPAEAGIHRGL